MAGNRRNHATGDVSESGPLILHAETERRSYAAVCRQSGFHVQHTKTRQLAVTQHWPLHFHTAAAAAEESRKSSTWREEQEEVHGVVHG